MNEAEVRRLVALLEKVTSDQVGHVVAYLLLRVKNAETPDLRGGTR